MPTLLSMMLALTLAGSRDPRATADRDVGALDASTQLHGVTLLLSRTPAQEAALQSLIEAQHNPASAFYQQWLTPEQFASRFGVTDAALVQSTAWLESQGLIVENISRARDRIRFSGTAAQVGKAFGAELHQYSFEGGTAFAPSAELTIPSSLASSVRGVANLTSFRPHPHMIVKNNFTSSQSGSHYVTPSDIATIYDLTPAYTAGFDGAGQTIAVVGQSSVTLSDIEKFQAAAGVAVHDPSVILVPGSGTSAAVSGDQAESDLDLEYTSSIAPGAAIDFVYVGNSQNFSVWDSIQYAVDQNLAPIISVSYGACELSLGANDYSSINAFLAQAATQGQSVIAASGDAGSTDCSGQSGVSTANQKALAVDFPASSQYVTGLGGTEFVPNDVASTNTTYFSVAVGSDAIGSAKSYIPEQVWNDDTSTNTSSGGGGVSTFTSRPSWQTGVVGIPSGTMRLVPDIALDSSPEEAGYLYCSSDSSTGVTGSCANGFRDGTSTYLTVAGGTSFAAPVFAGMVALLNQKVAPLGQGIVASTLYSLAASSSTYASAFHDITSGSNASSSVTSYSATTGYDEATGLGSVDFFQLMSAWPGVTSAVASTTHLTAATATAASGATDAISISVTSTSGTPGGTVSIAVDGAIQTTLTLSSGAATYDFSSATAGAHTIIATYSGDANHLASRGTASITVTAVAVESFTIAAAAVTVPVGGSGVTLVTVTPKNGYTGTVIWTVSSSPALEQSCFSLPSAVVSSSSAATSTLTINASASTCGASSSRSVPVTSGLAASGLLFVGAGLAGRRRARRKWAALLLALAACGGPNVASTANDVKGTFTITLVGTDSASASIAASTTLTLTIQ